MSHYLYRKSRNQAIAVVAVLVLSAVGTAQIRDRTEHKRADEEQGQTQPKKPAKRGPRAIGVIEFLPKGGARLVPIALWMDGRYYDASFYGANPAPMALQPETLYQGLSYGEPTGWFTVTTPEHVNGTWVAEGHWKPQQGSLETKIAEQAAKQPKKRAQSPLNDDSGPPVLRRAPGSGSPESESSSSGASTSSSGTSTASGGNNPSAQAKEDSDRPTLKNASPSPSNGSSSTNSTRPTLGPDTSQPSQQASTTPTSSAPAVDNDPDRPTLKNSSPPSSGSSASTDSSRPTLGGNTSPANAQATTPPPPTPSADENDPDRPTLHRGKASAPLSQSASANVSMKPKPSPSAQQAYAPAAPAPKASAAANRPQSGNAYPAISDAGNYEIRSLLYAMTPAEKEERGKPMLALSLEEVGKYAGKRQQGKVVAKPATKAPIQTLSFVVTDYDLRAFDLDFSNSPTLVLTAKVHAQSGKPGGASDFDYFVTVVARVDINGEAQKVFSSVTDNNHLDAFPRLEIIDAVDADANGRGDLLFRQHSDSGVSYALYRVYPYQMVKVFEGGSNM